MAREGKQVMQAVARDFPGFPSIPYSTSRGVLPRFRSAASAKPSWSLRAYKEAASPMGKAPTNSASEDAAAKQTHATDRHWRAREAHSRRRRNKLDRD